MSVFRVNKNKNYTVVANYHLRDKNLSLKAKGLLTIMLSLPEDWDYSMNGLVAIVKEEITAVKTALHELEEYNYLKRTKFNNKKGHFEFEYHIYEQPYIENPSMVNHIQLSTNNKDKLDKQNILEIINPITKELINNNFLSINDLNIFYYDNLIRKLLNKYEYKDIISAINYTVNKIKENNYTDENNNKIINLFGYFKSSLISNLNKITNDIELYEGAE